VYLPDTNILSELIKRRPNPQSFLQWFCKNDLQFYKTIVDKMVGIYTGKRAYHFDGIDVLPLNDFLKRLYEGEIF
jgi:hypothetical protein